MRQDELTAGLRWLLEAAPGQDKHQLQAGLRQLGLGVVDVGLINRTLYGLRSAFVRDAAELPRWRVVPPRATYAGREPRAWQREALDRWNAGGRRGVVEAVTGTGKTTVGVVAAAAAVDAGERVLVLVPTADLLQQWYSVLRRDLPGLRIGRRNSAHRDSLVDHDVLVAVVHSAAGGPVLPDGVPGLLVADEVHRYGAPYFARALDERFGARLGLTATYTRADDLLEENLVPYFGPVVAGCTYARGLAEEILAPFRVGFVGTEFTGAEGLEYDEYDKCVQAMRRRLTVVHGCPEEPFGEFMAAVSALSAGSPADPAVRDARRYLHAFSKRRQLLAECAGKFALLADLAPALAVAQGSLVFGDTKAGAATAADVLSGHGVRAAAMTSDLTAAARRKRLSDFQEGRVRVLAAPRILDEGIDVPEADLGVIMAASRSKRQMIQRMGRVIRPKSDKRPATFLIMYVSGTAEDPAHGAHEDFRDDLVDVAREIRDFGPAVSPADLSAWVATH